MTLNIESCHFDFLTTINALVMKSLVKKLPSQEFQCSDWSHIQGLNLADPNFNEFGPIDLILDAGVCSEIFLPEIRRGSKNSPTALNTKLGWIIFGKISSESQSSQQVSINTYNTDDLLKRFFEIESITEEKTFTEDEKFCINHFHKTVRRDSDGRFILKLPFRTILDPKAVLGKSREIALKQFLFLEKKFDRNNTTFREEYSKHIMDFYKQGHMKLRDDSEKNHLFTTEDGLCAYNSYYLPHHPVVKESSTSTRVRPVFNASKKSTNGNSLNDILFPGPAFQKMYRQIRIADEDQSFLRILHRENPDEDIQEFALTRLPFGLNYSPCGAILTINELARQNENEFPEAAAIIQNDIYVDDTFSGSHSVDSACLRQREIIKIFNSGGFELKK